MTRSLHLRILFVALDTLGLTIYVTVEFSCKDNTDTKSKNHAKKKKKIKSIRAGAIKYSITVGYQVIQY